MKKLQKKVYIFVLLLGLGISLQNCQVEEIVTPLEKVLQTSEINKTPKLSSKDGTQGKVDVCHLVNGKIGEVLLNVSQDAVASHKEHGDVIIDEDGDGFAVYNKCGMLNENGIDCDDTNPAINPGVTEIPYNGIDDDCNPETFDDDLDADGFYVDVDCDDYDNTIFPGAEEIKDNKDNDCDGKIDESYTYVPDDNFEKALIDLGYDDIIDDYVNTNDINTIISLTIRNKGIQNITGIEDFMSLTYLDVTYNQLSNLDISQNIALKTLYCGVNQLTNLDVTNNVDLVTLNFGANQIDAIDLTNNTNLVNLHVFKNQLLNIDLSKCLKLRYFSGYMNSFTNVDLSLNTDLIEVFLDINKITNLVLGNNTSMTKLFLNNNLLANIDVSGLTSLKSLQLFWNRLITINLSNNNALKHLNLSNNKLTSVNLKNGNNSNLYPSFKQNPSLTCIEVDDGVWSTTNWGTLSIIEPWMSFSENCNY